MERQVFLVPLGKNLRSTHVDTVYLGKPTDAGECLIHAPLLARSNEANLSRKARARTNKPDLAPKDIHDLWEFIYGQDLLN